MIELLKKPKIEKDPEHIKKMTNYFLRNIEPSVWLKCRVKATKLNVPMRKVILHLVYCWLDNNFVNVEKQISQQEFNFK